MCECYGQVLELWGEDWVLALSGDFALQGFSAAPDAT